MFNTDRHPDHETLRAHLDESLDRDRAAAVETHLSECFDCQKTLAALAADKPWWTLATDLAADGSAADMHSPTDRESESQDGASPADLWFVEGPQIESLLAPTDDPGKLGRLGTYEVVGIVGAGATSVVLKAHDGSLGRFVAIKLLRPTLAASVVARKRFAREARAAAAIVHENVIEIYGVDETAGLPYLVMPYIRGQSLSDRIRSEGPLPVEAVITIGLQVAEALAAAHGRGVIHRDVKPGNILLGEGIDRLKLTDFGLARAIDDVSLTRSGTVAGTPEYMSPEQAVGKEIDPRSDLFSLGSVLHHMTSGRPPFESDSFYGVLRQIVEESPRPIRAGHSAAPIWLGECIAWLMRKDPGHRPSGAAEVVDVLRSCLEHVRDPRQPLPRELRPGRRRGPRRVMLGYLVVGVLAALLLAVFVSTKAWLGETPVQTQVTDSADPSADVRWDDGVSDLLRSVDRDLEGLER